jgi:phosphatidylserine/phosphatidylglycerophosphate/cardiolipin synthase-like enzyme
MVMDDAWLDAATPSDLEVLADSLRSGVVAPPYLSAAVKLAGADGAQSFLAGLGRTEPKVIAWMLKRLARERREASDRHAGVAHLVWSGAVEGEQAIRDTRVVLDELFRQAERSVLVSTYVVYDGKLVFAELAQRLRERPDLNVEIYVNLPVDEAKELTEARRIHAFLKKFQKEHWPANIPLPALYYDTESETEDGQRIILHAKTLVVDDRWAFITSANYTAAGQERNIEAGVLLDHPELAKTLAARFRALRESGRIRRMTQ